MKTNHVYWTLNQCSVKKDPDSQCMLKSKVVKIGILRISCNAVKAETDSVSTEMIKALVECNWR